MDAALPRFSRGGATRGSSVRRKVSAAAQNQALQAVLFLYRQVFGVCAGAALRV